MSGKGDKNRTADRKRFDANYDAIDWGTAAGEPDEDVLVHTMYLNPKALGLQGMIPVGLAERMLGGRASDEPEDDE